jgi:hypothetical protein
MLQVAYCNAIQNFDAWVIAAVCFLSARQSVC